MGYWFSMFVARTAAVILIVPTLCTAQELKPSEAFDRYLAAQSEAQPACFDSVFAVQIEAAMPALNRHASMSGFKWILPSEHAVYRGLRFTGDAFLKQQVIARFLGHDTNPPVRPGDVAVTTQNYVSKFERLTNYNGRKAYVFLLKPRRKRAGLFQGELWLDAETAASLRLWGDLVRSPSLLVRSFRFVQDYQTVRGCTEPLRLILRARARIAGAVEMTVWLRPVPEVPGVAERSEGY